ncbi:MAG: preprotein translocase subunit SecG [Gammaproteobacteria bacterium]|nr:preprotein translocase subunit SecG [Gammaproteobacteria bacterium]
MQQVLQVVHILLALGLIALILLQQGSGATTGAAFGSGASNTMFGSRGSGSFLTRATGIIALIFFSNSLFLAYLGGQSMDSRSLMERVEFVDDPAAEPTDGLPVPAEDLADPAALPDIPVPE